MTWTEATKAQLRRLWLDGLSASQIASKIGGVTRNAVIGAVHRMGLSGRSRPPAGTTGAAPSIQPPPRCARAFRIVNSIKNNIKTDLGELDPATEATDIPSDQSPFAVTFAQLAVEHCRWPLGDPSDFAALRFCGAPKRGDGSSYCSRHAMLSRLPSGWRPNVYDPSVVKSNPRPAYSNFD